MDPSKQGLQTPGMNLTGFNFASPVGTSTPALATTTAAPPALGTGFTFGSSAAPKTTTSAIPPLSGGLTFGASTSKMTGVPSFGANPATTTVAGFPAVNFNMPQQGSSMAPTAAPSTTAALPAFNFGISSTPTATTASGAIPASTTAPSTNLQLGQAMGFKLPMQAMSAAGPAITGFGLSTSPAKTQAIGGAATTTATLTAAPATTTGMPTFKLPATTSAAMTTTAAATTASSIAVPGLGPPVPITTAPPATTAAQSLAGEAATMTYAQLEDMINKWTVELGEQERQFLNQATQINAWDNLLNSNVSKLTALHNMVEEVKLEQAKINCDLDFILTQQKELDACLIPLEKEYTSSIYTNDVQREKMYSMAENIDSKLKRMSEDLKETIDHINETSRSQESIDPVLQIGRILNAHMNSLQWVDEQCSKLQTEFESVDKIHENMKREIDRQYSSYY